MSARAFLLALSLVANAALLGAYFMTPAASLSGPAPARANAAPVSRPAPGPSTSMTDAAGKAVAATAAQAGFSWSAIETDDLDELVRRLKAAGFTFREIRTILGDMISRRGLPPGADEAMNATPYWRYPWAAPADAKAREEQRKRNLENGGLWRQYVMGPDSLADEGDSLDYARRRWGNLPLAKLQALAIIDADYEEVRMKQFADQRVRPGEESNALAMYRMTEKERMADIAKVLTPEEFAAFELRSSPTANLLRFRLDGFNATEEEYKTIYAINQAYTERLYFPGLSTDATKALQAEINAKVRDALGADRALDYDAVMNHNARDQTGVLVERLGLPARVAVEVRTTAQYFTQQGKDIRANGNLSPAERDTQLAALAHEAEVRLRAKLGADGFEAYSDLKGDWLRNLQPKPATP